MLFQKAQLTYPIIDKLFAQRQNDQKKRYKDEKRQNFKIGRFFLHENVTIQVKKYLFHLKKKNKQKLTYL